MPASFIANNPVSEFDKTLSNNGFYPDLDLADFTRSLSVSGMGEEALLTHLQTAMLRVNVALAGWKSAYENITRLEDIPADRYGGISEKVIHYKAAVYYMAKASIFATNRDFTSTKSGQEKSQLKEESTHDLLELAQRQIANIMGESGIVVELI